MAEQPKPTDAIALLKQEHREVLDAFEQFEKASDDGRKAKLAKQICTDLTIHAMLEEEIFYPSFRGKISSAQLWQLAAYVRSMSGLTPPDTWPARTDHMQETVPRRDARPQRIKP